MNPTQDAWLHALYDAMFNGGSSMQDGGKSISQSTKEIHSLNNVAATKTDLNGGVLNLAADNLNKYNAIMAKLNIIQSKIEALSNP